MTSSFVSRPRVRRLAFPVLAAGLVTGIALAPAQAAAAWPSGGYTPTCDNVSYDGTKYTYTDATKPTIVSVKPPTYIPLTKDPAVHTLFSMHVVDSCSGVGTAVVTYSAGGLTGPLYLAQTKGTAFDGTWAASSTPSLGSTGVGAIVWHVVQAWDSYTTFALTPDHTTLLISVSTPGTDEAARGLELSGSTYLVHKTYASAAAASKAKVAKGQKVTVRATFTAATTSDDAAVAGVKVQLQRKLPGGSWKNVGSKVKTSSAGLAKIAVKVTAKASYRFTYPGEHVSLFYAPVSSKAVTVAVS